MLINQNDIAKMFKYIYSLNICGMSMNDGFDFPNSLKFLCDFVKSTFVTLSSSQTEISFSSINYRLILYPIHLLKTIITKQSMSE